MDLDPKNTRFQYIAAVAGYANAVMETQRARKKKFEKRIVEVLENEIEPKTLRLKEVLDGN